MSYDIYYNRLFLDLGKGRVLPMVIYGSNNSGDPYNERKRLREWICERVGDNYPITTIKQIEDHYDPARMGDISVRIYGSKMVGAKELKTYMVNSAKTAVSIEKLIETYSYIYLYPKIVYGYRGQVSIEEEKLTTTKDILNFIIKMKIKGYMKYIDFTFPTIINEMHVPNIRKDVLGTRTKRKYKHVKTWGYWTLYSPKTGYLVRRTKYGHHYVPNDPTSLSVKKFYSEKRANSYMKNTSLPTKGFKPEYIEHEYFRKVLDKGEQA